MKLWKKAAGALKDQNSIWIANVSRRSVYRSPALEAAIIRATSHDESFIDYKNVQRVFKWVRTSPHYLKPLVLAITARMERTGSWCVVLKGLMLMHGIFCCKIPAVQYIGRLPFDLSNFSDAHITPHRSWGYNAFVRAYFTFLDQKSALLNSPVSPGHKKGGHGHEYNNPKMVMTSELVMLQEMQSLLDLLLQIKPKAEGMKRDILVLEAMDCVIIEIFDVYSKICAAIARVLSHVYDSTRAEAATILNVLEQANQQAEELSNFFEFCKSLGVLNASEFPEVERIPSEDIEEVERIVNGHLGNEEANNLQDHSRAIVVKEMPGPIIQHVGQSRFLTTIVTDKWEIFDDGDGGIPTNITPVAVFSGSIIPSIHHHQHHNHRVNPYPQEIPDLITF